MANIAETLKTSNSVIKLKIMENIGNHKKLSPKNQAIPDPNDAPLANPNVKLSASGLFNTI